MSHVALPFRADDPVYGNVDTGLRLGNLALRGERGMLHVSAANLLRLRWNPFHDYMEQRIVDFMLSAP